MSEKTTTVNKAPISWSGSFPQNYEDNLGPFIFGPYALELVSRINPQEVSNVLELACGTGQVTTRLLERLGSRPQLTATDLSPEMMTIARGKLSAPNLTWETVDMIAIPYPDNTFDLLVCQFGLMFAPDKAKALSEMYRVLRPGGWLLFSTWGTIANNRVFQVFNEVLIRLMDMNVGAAEQGPFSMPDEQAVLHLMATAGFTNSTAYSVTMVGEAASAAQAAKGFFQGSALSVNVNGKNPALAIRVQQEIEQDFISQMGDNPMRTPLQAWVFSAKK